MRLVILSTLALAASCVAEDMSINMMGTLMSLKTAHHDVKKSAGVFREGAYRSMGATKCKNGKAGEYSCENIDLLGSLTHEAMGSTTREGNDVWGWTSLDGREFAMVGQTDGTAFVEVLKGGSLKYLGRLPTQTTPAIWRDIKVIGSHAYISSESPNHGIQIFNLTKLLTLGNKPKIFDIKSDLTARFDLVGSAHNVIANKETNTIYIVGAETNAACNGSNGGLVMIDVKDPSKPKLLGCAGQDGYIHDATCMTYRGMDKQFNGHEICFTFNEDTFNVYDVTDKKNPVVISKSTYDGFEGKGAYTHQGWVVDKDYHYLLLDDELDEEYRGQKGGDTRTTTYIFDISSLAKPKWTGAYKSPVSAIDHNLYVVNGLAYMANYGSGLRVVDVSKLAKDPTGGNMKEVANFDCWPEDDDDPKAEFSGAWSSYMWFKSGTVILNCIERGVFALKVNV